MQRVFENYCKHQHSTTMMRQYMYWLPTMTRSLSVIVSKEIYHLQCSPVNENGREFLICVGAFYITSWLCEYWHDQQTHTFVWHRLALQSLLFVAYLAVPEEYHRKICLTSFRSNLCYLWQDIFEEALWQNVQ